MKRPKKIGAPKALTYVLIPCKSDVGQPMYTRLYDLVARYHSELDNTNVRIALAWATSWKADVDGRLTLGKCKKASELDRELAPYDFVILLNKDFWQNPHVSDAQRDALLDHELMHAAVALDEKGDPKRDEAGRTIYRIRKHDLEEFADIVARHGLYKRDIEEFVRALHRAEAATTSWVGYTRLHDELKAIGLEVPTHVIATWPDDGRREVMTWALLRASDGVTQVNVQTASHIPPCLAAALGATVSDTSPH